MDRSVGVVAGEWLGPLEPGHRSAGGVAYGDGGVAAGGVDARAGLWALHSGPQLASWKQGDAGPKHASAGPPRAGGEQRDYGK